MWWRNYSQTLFWNIKTEHISASIVQNFMQFLFIVCQVEGYRNILQLSCRPFALTHFLKKKHKEVHGTSFPSSFSAWFLKKNISLVIFYNLVKFNCLVAFTSWDVWQNMYCNCLLTELWRHKFWNYSHLSN